MKEPYGEGLASHSGPESCACDRKGMGEALTGERAGQVSSREMALHRVPTPWGPEEGHTVAAAIARQWRTRRGQRPCACTETLCAEAGRSHDRPRGDGPGAREVNPKGARPR